MISGSPSRISEFYNTLAQEAAILAPGAQRPQPLGDVRSEVQVAASATYALVTRIEIAVRRMRATFAVESERRREAADIADQCQELIGESERLQEACNRASPEVPAAGASSSSAASSASSSRSSTGSRMGRSRTRERGRPPAVLSGARWEQRVSAQLQRGRQNQYQKLHDLFQNLRVFVDSCEQAPEEQRQQIESALQTLSQRAQVLSAPALQQSVEEGPELAAAEAVGSGVNAEAQILPEAGESSVAASFGQGPSSRVRIRPRAGSVETRAPASSLDRGADYLDLAVRRAPSPASAPVAPITGSEVQGREIPSRESPSLGEASDTSAPATAVLAPQEEAPRQPASRLNLRLEEQLQAINAWSEQIIEQLRAQQLAEQAGAELAESPEHLDGAAEPDPLPFAEGASAEPSPRAASAGMTPRGPAPTRRAPRAPARTPVRVPASRRAAAGAVRAASSGIFSSIWRAFSGVGRVIRSCGHAVWGLLQRLWNRVTSRTQLQEAPGRARVQ